jgi:hypothetical protein
MKKKIKYKILGKSIEVIKNTTAKSLMKNGLFNLIDETDQNIRKYFESKTNFQKELIDSFFGVIKEEIDKSASKNPKNAVKKLTRLLGWILTDKKRTRFILNLLHEAEEDQALKNKLKKSLKKHLPPINSLLTKNAKKQDAELIMALLWGVALQHFLFSPETTKQNTKDKIDRLVQWLTHLKLIDINQS